MKLVASYRLSIDSTSIFGTTRTYNYRMCLFVRSIGHWLWRRGALGTFYYTGGSWYNHIMNRLYVVTTTMQSCSITIHTMLHVWGSRLGRNNFYDLVKIVVLTRKLTHYVHSLLSNLSPTKQCHINDLVLCRKQCLTFLCDYCCCEWMTITVCSKKL